MDYLDLMRLERQLKQVPPEEYEQATNQASAFYRFYNVERPKIREEFPEWTSFKVDEELENRWYNNEETRSKYIEMVKNDRQKNQPSISDENKKRSHDITEKDNEGYAADMQNFISSEDKDETGSRKRRPDIKDPAVPKKSLTAFFWFCNDERGKVRSMHPEHGVVDIAKELAKKWSDADAKTKSKYETIAEEDKARYEREMTAYRKKLRTGESDVEAPATSAKYDDEENAEEGDGQEDDK